MAQVEKIYSLKTLGFDTIMTELDQLAKKFVEVKKAKQDAAKTAADAAKNQGLESQAYKDAAKALDEQKIKELELKAAIKEKTNEAKAAQLVRQADINQQKAAITGNAAEANSIAAIRKERAELNAAVIRVAPGSNVEFRGNTLQYDEAIAKLKELSSVEQAFRRQFQQDGTLVGEYTSGIIQAFKKMGIDDLVTGQVTKANEKLQNLNEQFEVLKNELRSIGTGSFEKLSAELNIVKNTGVSGFGSIEAKIKEVATSGGVSLGKIDQLLEEIKANGNTALSGLEKELIQIRESATGALGNLEKELITNRKEALALQQQIGTLQTELRGTGDIGSQITTGLANGFKSMRGQLGQFLLSYVGFQAAFQGILSGIDTAKELADQTTNLEIELDKTAGGADKLVSALAKLNTRTKLTDLETIANIAAKAGVSEQNLLGVTEALDKIKIAFGKDFGDVEAGTESLVKLINIFEGADNVTGENLLKTGNAVRTLANESVASVPFLNDFARRMAGLKGISDIALPAVLGLASGFEQFGQSSEVAGTALTKVIPKLASDTAKYAEIAGMTQKAFSDLLKNNPAEALIRVSEALVKGKGSIEEISTAFADSELGTGRIAAILGTVGSKADDFRKSIASAGLAFNDTGNIESAFAAKNENLASTLDKISKSFADAANSTGFKLTITAIAGVISLLINNLGILAGVLTLFATGWAIANAEMIKTRIITLATNIAFQAQYATIVIGEIITKSYTLAVTFLNTAFLRAAASSAILRAAIQLLAGPIGIIIGIVSLLALSAVAFGKAVTTSVDKLRELARQQAIANEVSQKASGVIAEQTSALAGWVTVIKSAASGADTKRAALQKLIEINPAFRDALQGQAIDLKKLDAIYKQVTESIRANAEAQASAELTAEKGKEVTAVTTVRQRLETEFSRGTGPIRTIGGFSDADIDKLFKDIDQRLVSIRDKGNGVIEFQATDFNRIKGNLKRQEDAAIGVFNDYVNVQAKTQAKLLDIENKAKEGAAKNAETVAKGFEVDITFLKTQIDALNQQIEAFKGSQKDLNAIIKKRNDLQAQLDAALGTQKAAGASKISGPEKDLLAQEDARRDLLLTLESRRRVTDQEDEETYLNNILKINQDSIDRKLVLIRGNGVAEQKLRAQLSLDRITLEKDTADKIQAIHNKEFTERQTVLKNQLDEDIAALREANDVVQSDTDALPSTKAQARVNADNKILALVQKYNLDIDALEKQLNANTVKNSKDLINLQVSTKKDALSATKDLDVSILADIDKITAEAIAKIKLRYDQLREDILKSKDSQPVKNTNLQTVDNAENLAVGSTLLDSAAKKKAAAQALFDAGLITAEQFQTIFDAANAAQKNLNDTIEKTKQKYTDLRSLITGKLSTLFKFDVDTEGGKAKAELLSQTLSQAYSVAQSAMDNFYAAEAAQIERSRTNNEKALQLEFDQKKSKAQSQAEQESLDKQFQARKEANDRDAFEKNKKIQREQAKVNLAIQLSNLAVIAFSPNPANIATLGIAGTIMYAIQAALALANYALNVGRINSAQFALGGEVPKRGGKFGGKAHSHGGTKFGFKGDQYEAEVDELAIIRTRNAPARNKIFQIAGTQQQIASQLNVLGGGIQFAPGAKLKRFEAGGTLGATLQAPVFVPSSNSSVVNNNNAELIAEIRGLRQETRKTADEQSRRIDRIKVAVNAHEIRKVSNQIDKAAKVGTL